MERHDDGNLRWLLPILLPVVIWGALGNLESARADEHHACESQSVGFCDRFLPTDARVADLVSALTIDEKIGMLGNRAPAVPRLGVPGYEWWSEGLHGVAYSPGTSFGGPLYRAATSFPQPILTAASFNVTLFNKIGQATSTEARAFYNAGQGGLTYWTPNINIFRDPRWGRGQETPGEDPLLTSTYAEYYVRGLQEDADYHGDFTCPAPIKLKLSACCKHYTAYDVDAWGGVERYGFNAVVNEQDLDDTFNPPFEACVRKGRASGLMCSYNAVNGIPTCADPALLKSKARGLWDFEGYVVSDCDAVMDILMNHKYTVDFEHAVAAVLRAGMDLNCGDTLLNYTKSALSQHLISEAEIDEALSHSLMVQFRLGMFDGNPSDQNYGHIGGQDVCSAGHQQLALEAALQSIVLLKNLGDVLPLSREIQSLAVIGPNADDHINTMLGNYAGSPCTYVTPLQGLQGYVSRTLFVPGCSDTACENPDIDAAISVAATSDATILVVGLSQEQEREALDRTSLLLPGRQQELVSQVAANSKGPVVAVVMSGGPVDISIIRDDEKIRGILWVGYPGQAGGQALGQILFGDANPGGKLPVTWYPESFTSWPMTTMDMRPDASSGYPGRTYRFYTGPTVYQFGDGMSYSTFRHSLAVYNRDQHTRSLTLAPPSAQQLQAYNEAGGGNGEDLSACRALEFTAEVVVVNSHEWRAGSDVVLLYASPPAADDLDRESIQASKRLVGLQRMQVDGNSTALVELLIRPCEHLTTSKSDGTREVLEGLHVLSVNGGEQNIMVNFSSVHQS